MSKRLQIVVSDEDLAEIQAAARAERVTVSEWVRRLLRAKARGQSSPSQIARRLAAIQEAAKHSFPAGDIEEMLRDIERGYLEG